MSKPTIAITMGDAAGIGPEIIVKALGDPCVHENCRPIVIGDAKILERANRIVGSNIRLNRVDPSSRLRDADLEDAGSIHCLDLDLLSADLPFGILCSAAGGAAYEYVKKAVSLACKGEVDAVCTAPLNKEALKLSGHPFPGHTEILADLTGTKDVRMMLASEALRVVLVTIHVGLIDAVSAITQETVFKTLVMTDAELRRFGLASPRIGVCGINPHAGEHGLFGRGEEEEKIVPAIQQARSQSIDASGPLPADTLFYRATRGDFDVVVAMYHDQGLAPIKTLGLESAVNVTLGLPIIRTSVDHGTAFDIAGKGIADDANLKVAILYAVDILRKSPGPKAKEEV
jgi:4-hydroxythreonine-4-phosphate dehydrogenase